MSAEFKIIQPREYYRNFLERDCRPDGRNVQSFRPITVNVGSIGTADGSALVKLGNTSVMCGIKAELCNPKQETPKSGYIVPNIELPPLCSPRFKPGPPSELAQVSSQLLANIIATSGCVRLQDLCIVTDKLVWCLYCDLVFLEYDGNILDSALTALMAALLNTKLPTVTVDPETDSLSVDLHKRNPLSVHSWPVSSTFAIFDSTTLISDPTNEEECLSLGTVNVVTLGNNQLCQIHKPGGSRLTDAQILKCVNEGERRHQTVIKLIKEANSALVID